MSKLEADLQNQKDRAIVGKIAMARALAYAAEKRADERRRLFGDKACPVTSEDPNSRVVTFNGRSLSIRQWAEISGLGMHTIRSRLDNGWEVRAALNGSSIKPAKSNQGGRPAKHYEIDGLSLTLREWCDRYGLGVTTARTRMRRGLSLEDALNLQTWEHRGIAGARSELSTASALTGGHPSTHALT